MGSSTSKLRNTDIQPLVFVEWESRTAAFDRRSGVEVRTTHPHDTFIVCQTSMPIISYRKFTRNSSKKPLSTSSSAISRTSSFYRSRSEGRRSKSPRTYSSASPIEGRCRSYVSLVIRPVKRVFLLRRSKEVRGSPALVTPVMTRTCNSLREPRLSDIAHYCCLLSTPLLYQPLSTLPGHVEPAALL